MSKRSPAATLVVAAVLFSLMAVVAKLAAARLPGPEVAFVRMAVGLVGCALGLAAGFLMAVDAKRLLLVTSGFDPPTVIPWPVIFIGVGATIGFEYAFLRYFSARLTINEQVYSGINGSSAIVVGTSLAGGGTLGVTASMPVGDSILAIVLGFIFSFLAIQCTGVTDITPLTTASKASQLVLGGATKGESWAVKKAQAVRPREMM